jgi:hypothetical protein
MLGINATVTEQVNYQTRTSRLTNIQLMNFRVNMFERFMSYFGRPRHNEFSLQGKHPRQPNNFRPRELDTVSVSTNATQLSFVSILLFLFLFYLYPKIGRRETIC